MNWLRITSASIALILAVFVKAEDAALYRLNVQDFTELKVSDGVNVEYHNSTDSAGWAYFTCTPSIAHRLLFTNNKSQLHIQVDRYDGFKEPLPTIHVHSQLLTKVENSSDSTIVLSALSPVKSFKASIIGNGTLVINGVEATSFEASINTGRGHIVATGKSARAKYTSVGTGPIEAGTLEAGKVKILLLGTGNIDCFATESLNIYGAGSGTVYFSGEPAKVTNRSLGVKSVNLNMSDSNN